MVSSFAQVGSPEHIVARREDVGRAAFSVIARDGFERASMRAIAAEMQCSTGVLTHHFRDKRAITKYVLDRLLSDLIEWGEHPVARAMTLERTILSLLPHDEESRAWWRVFLHFSSASINDASLRVDEARREAVVVDRLKDSLKREIAAGRLPKGLDVDQEAHALLPFIDGLGFHAVLDPSRYTRAMQKKLLRATIDRLAKVDVSATT